MGNPVDNKFTWVIKNFCSVSSKPIYSDQFLIGGYKWRILAYPKKRDGHQCFCLDLELVDCEFLPSGWRSVVKISFTVVNYFSKKLSSQIALKHLFTKKERSKGLSLIHLSELTDKKRGFLVDGEVEIVAQIDVRETDHKLHGSKDYDMEMAYLNGMATTFIINKEPNDDDKAGLVNVKGFQVLPSQLGIVNRIFEKHPETALECCTKNQELRASYINVIFSLIKMLYKGAQEHSTHDLSDAEGALAYMKNVGFKLDWLEKKLDEVKEIKKKCERVTEMQQELHDLMNKHTNVSILLEKEKLEIKNASAPDLSFSDVI
ncbi:TRAF-like [Arabidopsis thaliana x Arabidopsis arenosa]|uniref:TRAF-like n=1 Tax=Arabidopsis thaliana x Arabidopsis arenosa TaxID=1240361 RepID=A0A8T1ZRP5_9BRAS|nr:TRAF-like [Arabidopsis thaliana x Arabidopsis arenosa]